MSDLGDRSSELNLTKISKKFAKKKKEKNEKMKKKKRKKKYILLRLNSRKKIKETLWGIFLDLFINIEDTALKITAGQRSLTVTRAFVTAEKLSRTVTMTANT